MKNMAMIQFPSESEIQIYVQKEFEADRDFQQLTHEKKQIIIKLVSQKFANQKYTIWECKLN